MPYQAKHMLILIDKSTIKKNPNAGRTISQISGPIQICFSMANEPPIELVDSKKILITEYSLNLDGREYCEGIVIDPGAIGVLKDAGADTERNQEVIEFSHLPEPSFFYNYENPSVPCSECHQTTLLNDIKVRDGGIDGEYQYTICPHCEGIDTFDIQYEPITDALKRL